jgi:hypothetical protein
LIPFTGFVSLLRPCRYSSDFFDTMMDSPTYGLKTSSAVWIGMSTRRPHFTFPCSYSSVRVLVRTSTVVLKRRDGDMIRLETRGPQEVLLGSASSANEDK